MVMPPASAEELLERGRSLAGLTLGALAARSDTRVPLDLKRAKGWVGALFEQCLGATAKSRAVPDFEALGIELKTLPVSLEGRPLETTFVCTIPLLDMARLESDNVVRARSSQTICFFNGSKDLISSGNAVLLFTKLTER